MVHGYHVVIAAYGFWLPNDPRGSWSDMIRKWELVKFGKCIKTIERRTLDELSEAELVQREHARMSLKYPAVSLTGLQARAVGRGFARQVLKSGYTIWACSILPERSHLVLARHRYQVEQMVNLLKGAASSELCNEGLHSLADFASPGGRPPRMWAEHEWKTFLDSEVAIEDAIRYVEENPEKEGKPCQHWSFVTPFAGIDRGGWQTYH